MRKPLVVVCAAASALLLAGGVVATSAGAEEAPDVPGFAGFPFPDWPGLPFGDDATGDGDATDGDAADDANDADAADGDATDGDATDGDATDGDATGDRDDPTGPDGNRSGADGGAADGSDGGSDGGDPVLTDPFPDPADAPPAAVTDPRTGDGGDRRPAGDDATRATQARQRAATVRRQVDDAGDRQRRADTAARPGGAGQQPGFSARGAGSGLLVGARRAVTAADISTSPAAPLQQRVLALVNENRRRGGCDPLGLDRRLIEAAHEHAVDMARRRYFAHESPNGDDAGERVSDAGYRWKRYSENIARGADSPWEVVDGWMNSRVHRENILDCRLREMGLGLAIAGDRTPYWVQDFATPDE